MLLKPMRPKPAELELWGRKVGVVEWPRSQEHLKSVRNVADPKNTFAIFPDGGGHWCARRFDGLVNGTFVDRDAAIRFVRREARHK